MNKNLIYALVDPETHEIRYIGKSTVGLRRAYSHKKPSELKVHTHKVHWIKSLHTKGLQYEVIVLEKCSSKEETGTKEQYWIKYYRDLGLNLTNATDGGEGTSGFVMSEETKQILREKRTLYYQNNPEAAKELSIQQRDNHKLIDGISYKFCKDCKTHKKLVDFGLYNRSWDKLMYMCKSCACIRNKEFRKENSVLLSEEQWNQSYVDRKEKMRQGVLDSFKANPELKINLSKKRSKPIIGVSIEDNNKVLKFESALQAKENGFNNTNLGVAIKNQVPYKGYMWKFDKKN